MIKRTWFLAAAALCLATLLAQPALAAAAEGAGGGAAAGDKERLFISLAGVKLQSVVLYISDFAGLPVLLPDGFPGDKAVDVVSSARAGVPPAKAMAIFASALRGAGYAMIQHESYIEIVREADTSRAPVVEGVPEGGIKAEGLMTTVTHVRNVEASKIVDILQALRSRGGSVRAYPDANKLVITDSAPNVRAMLALLKRLDTPWGDSILQTLKLKNTSVEAVMPTVSSYVRSLVQSAPASQKKRLEQLSVQSYAPANSILLFGHPDDIGAVQALIQRLDVKADEAARRIHTYAVLNRDATEMAGILTSIIAAAKDSTAASQFQPTVIADKTSNLIVVIATPARYEDLLSVIHQFDKPKAQVLIEAALVEMSMDAFRDLGTELASLDGPGSSLRGFSATSMGLSTTTADGRVPIEPALGGLTAALFKDKAFNIAALIRLSDQRQDISLIAAPRVLASDGKTATINISEQREYLRSIISPEGTTSEVTHGGWLEAGIVLEITPHINAEGTIRLEIKTETDEFLPSTGGTTNRNARTAQTEVNVPDGYPIVIAGLTRTEQVKTVRKVPLLGDIPLLGFFFSRTETTRQQRNLCVFIKPSILMTTKAIAAETARSREALRALVRERKGALPEDAFDAATGQNMPGVKPNPEKPAAGP